jgi:hypothetical protein
VFGQVEGKMHLELNPCDRNGNTGPWDDEEEELDPFVDDPAELLRTQIQFEVKIGNVSLDAAHSGVDGVCKYDKIFVRYKFNANDEYEDWSKTQEKSAETFDLELKFSKKHKTHVDEEVLQHIQKGKISFQLWGNLSTKAMMQAHRPGTADGMSTRLEAKKRELEDLEIKVNELHKKLEEKNSLIAEKNKELTDLDRQIAAKQGR